MVKHKKRGLSERLNDRLNWNATQSFLAFLVLSVLFWYLLHHAGKWSVALLVSLSVASFMLGCLIGFLFSSYDEEAATVGKVRDWLIGGLTGITIIKFRSIEGLLLTFASGAGPQPFALVVAVSITYAICGFFAMFFQRELILNVLLAASRKKRGLLEGGTLAGAVARDLLSNVPLNLLLGQVSSEDLSDAAKLQREDALKILKSDEIKEFLQQAETAVRDGAMLDWDVVSKVATLHYYLVYAVEASERDAQLQRAQDWLTRALTLYPGLPDFEAKYADILNERGKTKDAIDLLWRVLKNPQAPAYVMQWLAVYLLAEPGHELESIKLSETYFRLFPSEHDSYFNIAMAYAGLYNGLVDNPAVATDPALKAKLEEYRKQTIENIRKALAAKPHAKLQASKDMVKGNWFYAKFLEMKEFSDLLA